MQIATATDTARPAIRSEATANKQLAATATKAASKPLANVQQNAARTESVTTLKALLTEFKLPADGKLARRFLRKASFGWHTHAERWEFTASQADDVRAVLAKLATKADKK